MADPIFSTLSYFRLTEVSWTANSVDKTTQVLEGYSGSTLTSVIYLGDIDPSAAYSSYSITATAYASGESAVDGHYPASEVGGSSKVFAIPYQYFSKFATDGLDFKAIKSTDGSTDILLLDGTKIELYDDGHGSWTAGTKSFKEAFAALSDSANAVSLDDSASISVELVGREVDSTGAIKTAFADLNTKLTAYYDDSGTDPEIALAAVLVDVTTPNSTGKVISDFLGGLSANSSLYAYKTAASNSDHSSHLFYNGAWVEVIVADNLAGLKAQIISGETGSEIVDAGIIEIGTFYDNTYTSKNLYETLYADGLLGKNIQSYEDQSQLGGVLWQTDQFDSEGYFWQTAIDLTRALQDVGYVPEYDGSNNAITSDLYVDTSDNKNNFIISFEGSTSRADGVNFSGSDPVGIAVTNLDSEFSLDLPTDFAADSKLYIYTNSQTDQGHVKLSGSLDADFDVIVQGNRALDIQDLGATGIPTDWTIKDNVELILTPTQYTAISSGSTISSNATLHFVGTSGDDTIVGSSNGDIIAALEGTNTVTGGAGDDKLYADQSGADTFVFSASGDGDDIIYNFNADSDTIKIGENAVDFSSLATGVTVSTNTEGSRVITYATDNTITLKDEVNDSPLKLTEVDGERWGDYVTFAVEAKSDITALETLATQISWNTSEFVYVTGSIDAGAVLPGGEASVLNTDDTGSGIISLEAIFSTAVDVSENADFFTFMLKRVDTEPRVNNISIDYVQHQLTADAGVESRSDALNYSFDYVTDSVEFNLETQGGVEAPSPKIIIADGNVMDGLSLVPIATYKDFTQYQVVLNISYPTAYVPLAVPASYSIEIDGDIIDDSIYYDEDARLTAELTAISETALLTAPGSTMVAGDYTEAWANLGFAQGYTLGATGIATQDGVDFSIDTSGIIVDDVTTTGDEGVAYGRYSLATFIATNEESIKFVSKSSDDATGKTVNISSQTVDASTLAATNITKTVNDGSEVYILGDHWYENPSSFLRAVTAADALAALKMSTDDTGYTNAQIISADFDRSKDVTAMDAYEILKYAAKKANAPDGTKFMDADYRPEWFYIDGIGNYTLDGDATPGGVDFDTAIDQFVGKNTVIDATAVLIGDVTQSYSPLSGHQDPIHDLGNYQAPVTAPVTNTGTNGGSGVDFTATWNVSSTDNAHLIGAPGAIIVSSGSGLMVTAADAETSGNQVTAAVSGGIMSFTSGGSELGTLDEWKDAAEIVASNGNTASTDKFVLGFVDQGASKTYVFELDDSVTEGTFVVSKTSVVNGVANSLSTAVNTSTSIKIDTATAASGPATIASSAISGADGDLQVLASTLVGTNIYTTGNSSLDAATNKVLGITSNAATDWNDVVAKLNAAVTVASNTTPGDAATIMVISNGTDARIYTFVDDATENSTVELTELTHTMTITGLSDVTSLVAADFAPIA